MTDLVALAVALKDLPPHVYQDGKAFLVKLFGEATDATADIIASTFRLWQWKNRIRIAHRAKEILDKDGVAAKAVAPSFLLPFVEAAGNVEDETLQELWAHLLASACAGGQPHPAYISILQQLAPDEAKALQLIGTDGELRLFARSSGNIGRPGETEYDDFLVVDHPQAGIDAGTLGVGVDNLLRLELVTLGGTYNHEDEKERILAALAEGMALVSLAPTVLGNALIKACVKAPSSPQREPSNES